MFVRITSFKSDPDRVSEMDAKIDEIRSILWNTPGLKHNSVARDENGNGVVIGFWESERAAMDAEEKVSTAWKSVADLISGPPDRRGYGTVSHLAGSAL